MRGEKKTWNVCGDITSVQEASMKSSESFDDEQESNGTERSEGKGGYSKSRERENKRESERESERKRLRVSDSE